MKENIDVEPTAEEVSSHNNAMYQALCRGTLGNNYDRMVIYCNSIIKEVIQGARGGSFSMTYINEKIGKLKTTAEDTAKMRHENC